MARSEARLFTSIWLDADFTALGEVDQRMYFFLLSQPDLSFCGRLSLAEKRWALSAAGLTQQAVHRRLAGLGSARFVVTDLETEEVLIRSLMRRDGVLRSPKLMKPLRAALAVVTSRELRDCLRTELERALAEDEVNPKLRDDIEGMVKSLFPQVDTLSDTLIQKTAIPYAIPTGAGAGVVSNSDPRTSVTVPTNENNNKSLELTETTDNRGTNRGSRIPPDFAVTAEMVRWARAKCPAVDGKLETEKFVNYWTAKSGRDAVKVDWAATWRNWMLTAAERNGSPPRRSTTNDRVQQGLDLALMYEERDRKAIQ
jgi:hypothetical protein